jgi:hypothetical protein
VSQLGYYVIYKKLALNDQEYSRNYQILKSNNDLKISVVSELSDLRIGGKVVLKCGQQGNCDEDFDLIKKIFT